MFKKEKILKNFILESIKKINNENYFKNELVLTESDLRKNSNIYYVLNEVLLYNNYDSYNRLDENTKLKIKNTLRNILIYGVMAGSLAGGFKLGSNIQSSPENLSGRQTVGAAYEYVSDIVSDSASEQVAVEKMLRALNGDKKIPIDDNVYKQLSIIISNKSPEDLGKFLIVDDKNNKLYVFSPDGSIEEMFPIITGEDFGDIDNFTFQRWLYDNDQMESYKLSKKVLEQGNSKKNYKELKAKSKIAEDLFNAYLSEREAKEKKITPSGVYTITKMKGKKEIKDRVAYGVGKISLSAGIDASTGRPITIAIHGTGIKDRDRNLRKAARILKRSIRSKRKALNPVNFEFLKKTPSYGCINLQNKNIVKLMSLLKSSKDSVQVYIMSDSGNGVVQFGDGTLENAISTWDAIVSKANAGMALAMSKYRQIKGSSKKLDFNSKKFKLK